MKKTSAKTITLALQYQDIKRKFNKSIISSTFKNNRFFIKLEIQPIPYSRTYSVQLFFSSKNIPEVWVYNIVNNGDKRSIPHIYCANSEKSKVKICLYYPKFNEFTSKKWLSKTIIPWTIEWLMHYELWQFTNEWHGGGYAH